MYDSTNPTPPIYALQLTNILVSIKSFVFIAGCGCDVLLLYRSLLQEGFKNQREYDLVG